MGERSKGGRRSPGDRAEKVALASAGLDLGGDVVPLYCGSLHYFRLSRSAWRPALEELKSLGARLVDTYIPWALHERGEGLYDFGEQDPRLDVVKFLELAGEMGLFAIVRPGPHVNAELSLFGLPERIIWDAACQARSPNDRPVVLPVLPVAFPVPSYASHAFAEQATRWLREVGSRLEPLVWPKGPIVMVQVDNEGALYFRDGVYDQDYHPDAIEQYRAFLRRKYSRVDRLRAAHAKHDLTFEDLGPPGRFDPAERGLGAHLDWAEFQEAMIESALYRFRSALSESGLGRAVTMHNLPIGEESTPLDPARIARSVDVVALDYYYRASEESRRQIARRTTELALRARAQRSSPFAAEMGAGFPVHFPPHTPSDSAFAVMTALAYGLRGFNIYMAVGRDRWIGGPIDERGRSRASADFWQRLFTALERVSFHQLSRVVPVRIVVPRVTHRLRRVLHAFGPLSPTLFSLSGTGAESGTLEDDVGAGPAAAAEVERFIRRLERALERAGIPFGFAGEDLLEDCLDEAGWTILVCPGALDRDVVERTARAIMGSVPVSVGPLLPERDGLMRETSARLIEPTNARIALRLPVEEEALDQEVGAIAAELDLPRLRTSPQGVVATRHLDARGKPRALFVINSTPEDRDVSVEASDSSGAVDALSGAPIQRRGDDFALRVPALSVAMLELS